MTVNITPDQCKEYQGRVYADIGDIDASYWWGYCHSFGTGGVKRNPLVAMWIWQEALAKLEAEPTINEQDNTGKIRYRLGSQEQRNRKTDLADAFYRQAVPRLEWESDQGDSESQILLGDCFRYGRGGLRQNHVLARYWFECAAERCHAEAENQLAWCYHFGIGGEQDDVQMTHWHQRAAEQEHVGAQWHLAHWYREGRGVEKDLGKAMYWYKRAAEQGHAEAQGMLAYYYQRGYGVEQDLVKAVEWLDRAIAQGHGDSIDSRQCLVASLGETERERVLGFVQRNKWMENVKQSAALAPSLGVWMLALEKVATAGSQNKWAAVSPTFLCLSYAIPQPCEMMDES